MRNKTQLLISIFALLAFSGSACSRALIGAPEPQKPPVQNQPGNTSPATLAPKVPEKTPIQNPTQENVKTNSELSSVPGTYLFTEGPATDADGNVFFSDINAGRIYKWTTDSQVSLFKEGLNSPNGLMFTSDGQLIACEGGSGRLISIDPKGVVTIVADAYSQKRFNEPNDLWIDPQGGIYFTDPVFQSKLVQDGEDVYYVPANHSQVLRVINDMVRPNGIVGTPDGKTLYVSDYGAGKTYSYEINASGALTHKKLFTALGSDGMTLDASGNLYLTTPNQVQIFNAAGNHLLSIPTRENPTNVTFAGKDGRTLFITARSAVYTLQIAAEGGLSNRSSAAVGTPAASLSTQFTLTSPEVVEKGLLPEEYTCDGARATLPIAWSGAPEGTKSFAVIMHHVAGPGDTHWYWVLYDIPVTVTNLVKNSSGIGTLGTNSVNKKTEYTPPCSKGPGPKMYTYTVYALSAQPQFSVPATQINRDALLEAMRNITIASAELHVMYSRK